MDRHVRWLRRRIIASVATKTAQTFAAVAIIAFALMYWRTNEGPFGSMLASIVIAQLVAVARIGHAMRNNPLNYVFMRNYIDQPFRYRVSRFNVEEEAHEIASQLPGFTPVATIRDSEANPAPVFDVLHDPSRLVAASIGRASGTVALISSLADGRTLVTDVRAMPPNERLVMNLAQDGDVPGLIAAHKTALAGRPDVVELASSAHQVVLESLAMEYDAYVALGPILSPFLDLEPQGRAWLRLAAKVDAEELAALPTRLGPDQMLATRPASATPPTPVIAPRAAAPASAAPVVVAPVVEAPVVASPVVASVPVEQVASVPVDPVEPVEPVVVASVPVEPVVVASVPVEPVVVASVPIEALVAASVPVEPVVAASEPVPVVASVPVDPVAAFESPVVVASEPVEPVVAASEPVPVVASVPVDPVAAFESSVVAASEPVLVDPVAAFESFVVVASEPVAAASVPVEPVVASVPVAPVAASVPVAPVAASMPVEPEAGSSSVPVAAADHERVAAAPEVTAPAMAVSPSKHDPAPFAVAAPAQAISAVVMAEDLDQSTIPVVGAIMSPAAGRPAPTVVPVSAPAQTPAGQPRLHEANPLVTEAPPTPVAVAEANPSPVAPVPAAPVPVAPVAVVEAHPSPVLAPPTYHAPVGDPRRLPQTSHVSVDELRPPAMHAPVPVFAAAAAVEDEPGRTRPRLSAALRANEVATAPPERQRSRRKFL